jgi:hypothetical protein
VATGAVTADVARWDLVGIDLAAIDVELTIGSLPG